MEERKAKIEELEKSKNAIADQVFAQFCKSIRINHIRSIFSHLFL